MVRSGRGDSTGTGRQGARGEPLRRRRVGSDPGRHRGAPAVPATTGRAYFDTAAVGLASSRLAATYHAVVDEWVAHGFDWVRGEQAANEARSAVARLIGADPADLALIPSVSSAAGLVAAQLGLAGDGENVVIGERSTARTTCPGASSRAAGTTCVRSRSGGAGSTRGRRSTVDAAPGSWRSAGAVGDRSPLRHRRDQRCWPGRSARSSSSTAPEVGAPVGQDLRHLDVLVTADHSSCSTPAEGWATATCHGPCRAVHPDQRRLARGADPFASSSARRWTCRPPRRASTAHQLARCARRHGRARRLRRLRTRRRVRAQQRAQSRLRAPSPASGGTRWTCPRRTAARSSASRSRTWSRPGSSGARRRRSRLLGARRRLRLSVHLYNTRTTSSGSSPRSRRSPPRLLTGGDASTRERG